eukprot:g42184.t1
MEQMGPLNYKIRGRGKVQIVNVRRLIKYDPFLLEDESVEEALKRMKEDFQEVPPIQKEDTLEEENAYRAPVTEKEETEKESKEDSNRKSAAGTQSKAPIVRGVPMSDHQSVIRLPTFNGVASKIFSGTVSFKMSVQVLVSFKPTVPRVAADFERGCRIRFLCRRFHCKTLTVLFNIMPCVLGRSPLVKYLQASSKAAACYDYLLLIISATLCHLIDGHLSCKFLSRKANPANWHEVVADGREETAIIETANHRSSGYHD